MVEMDISDFLKNEAGKIKSQIFKLKDTRKSEKKEDLETYTGIVRWIDSPFNIFVNVNNINDKAIPYIYFFSYSMGKERVILW
jgi:hypothetical protein